MRYNRIKTCDTQNTDGLCVSLWLQGCPHKCSGCWNKETWDFDGGLAFTEREIEYIIDQVSYGQNLAILGGEPLIERNIESLTCLCKAIKTLYPNQSIWLWTGYDYEQVKHLQLFDFIDYVIDGQYIEGLNVDYRVTLNDDDKYRGSCNQKIINLSKRGCENESN